MNFDSITVQEAVRRSLPESLVQPRIDCLGTSRLGEAWPHSPFEAVRSAEIVPLLRHFFEPEQWIELGGLWFILGFTLRPAIYRNRAYLEWLLRLDVQLTRAGIVPPIYGFGLFRPRAAHFARDEK